MEEAKPAAPTIGEAPVQTCPWGRSRLSNDLTAPAESHSGPIRIGAVDDAGRWAAGGMSPTVGSRLPPLRQKNLLGHSSRREKCQLNLTEDRTRGWQLEPLGGVSDHMHMRILPYEGSSATRYRETEPAHPRRPARIRNLSWTRKVFRQEKSKQKIQSSYLRKRQRVYI